MPPDEANQSEIEKLRQLRQHVVERYNLEELRDLCFDLGVDYESLPGEGKAAKARELVDYMRRRNRLAELETETGFQMVAISEEDSQFQAYFAALEKRFAIYDDPSKMIALRMQPGTLSPVERPAEGDWADDFEELSQFYLQPRFARPPAPDQSQPIIENVATYLKTKKKVVLLGEPGAGKSTTLRLLAKAIRRAYTSGSSTPPTLPLYAALNQWPKGSSLMEFLQRQITGVASYLDEEGDRAKLAELAQRLPELVKAGRVVVLLDGLNELPGLQRDKLKGGAIDDERARMIEQMAHEPMWAQTLCLLSCRIKDFAGDPVRWHDLHLQPLTRPQVETLALAHYQDPDLTNQLIADLYDRQGQTRYDSLRYEWVTSQEKLRELCQQPFYLVRLLHYYREQGKLADNPAQLIKTSVEAALAREVNERKTMTQAEADELQTRLGYLAFNLTSARKVGGVDKDKAAGWLFPVQQGFSKEELEASLGKKETAEKLIKQAEDANLLSDNGEAIQFYHQLLQEYFTAFYLQSQPLTKALVRVTSSSPSNEVWRLWAGLNETLVAQVAAFLKIEESEVRRDAAQVLGWMGEPAVLPLIAALKDQDMGVRINASMALLENGELAVLPLITALQDENSDVRYLAAGFLGDLGDGRALPELERLASGDEGQISWGGKVKDSAAEAIKKIKTKQAGK